MAHSKNLHKEEVRSQIVHAHTLPPRTRAVILLDISDESITTFIERAGEAIWVSCIRLDTFDVGHLVGVDALISDRKSQKLDLIAAMQHGVVPILPVENDFPKTFSEFDPMKFEGNAFLFTKIDPYLIFEKLVRYLENIRYTGDKRTLLTNVTKTF